MHQITEAQLNHLRRLLGWVRCSEGVFQSPEEIKATWKDLNAHGITPSDHAETRERLMQHYNLSCDVPKYIRAAIKALEPVVRQGDAVGEIVDAHAEKNRLEAPREV